MPVTNMPVVWVSKPRLRVSWLHVLAAAEGLQDVVPQLGAPPFPLPDGVLGEGVGARHKTLPRVLAKVVKLTEFTLMLSRWSQGRALAISTGDVGLAPSMFTPACPSKGPQNPGLPSRPCWSLTYTGTQCKKVYTEWGL